MWLPRVVPSYCCGSCNTVTETKHSVANYYSTTVQTIYMYLA